MARGSAGSRRRRLGVTGPGLGRLQSLQPRPCRSPAAAPSAGGSTRTPRHHHHPWGGGAHKGKRPRAGGRRGGVPRGRKAWEVRDCSALSARGGRTASGTPPLSSSGRRHRLTLFATLPLSFQALKPQSSAAAQVPPLPRHHSPPPDRHLSLRSREISCLTGPTLRATRLRARARVPRSVRILNAGRSCPNCPAC